MLSIIFLEACKHLYGIHQESAFLDSSFGTCMFVRRLMALQCDNLVKRYIVKMHVVYKNTNKRYHDRQRK